MCSSIFLNRERKSVHTFCKVLKGGILMHVYLFCDKSADFLPMSSLPEILLPYGNIPLLSHILRYLESEQISHVTLIHADVQVRRTAESLPLRMNLSYADMPLCTDVPSLVLFRPCLPPWNFDALYALSGSAPVRLSASAALLSAGAELSMPEHCLYHEMPAFRPAETSEAYRKLQQNLAKDVKYRHFRIGQGVRMGKHVQMTESSVIGNDCVIGDHAVLEDCVLLDGVQIGAGASLRRCILCRHALVDRDVQLKDAVIGEGEICPAYQNTPVHRHFCVDERDGIHEGLPRWNSIGTALQAGAAMTAIGMRIAVGADTEAARPFADAAIAGAVSQGAQVWDGGVCARSQLISIGQTAACDALLWVQGDGVLRLHPYGKPGLPLDEIQHKRILQALEAKLSTRIVPCGKRHDARPFLTLWEERIRQILPEQHAAVEICCGDKRLRKTAEALYSGGMGDRIVLNLSEDGTTCTAFSQESGMVRHEQLLLLSLLSFREDGEALAIPAQFHPAAEGFAAWCGGRILRMHTPAVSPIAAKRFAEQGICTDGILLFSHILRILELRQISLADAVKLLPDFCTMRTEISTALSRQTVENLRRRNPDRSIRIGLPDRFGIVQILAYAHSMEAASELCDFWKRRLAGEVMPQE